MAKLNYEPFPDFNKAYGMLLGVLRIHFASERRIRVKSMEWKKHDSTRFQPAMAHSGPHRVPTPYTLAKVNLKRVSREARDQSGQSNFRSILAVVYDNKCCISGCPVAEALEGAHIDPFSGVYSDHPQNGLLLRHDLNALFNLGLLAVHPDTHLVHFAPSILTWPDYRKLHKRARLAEPKFQVDSCKPSRVAIERRWREFVKGSVRTDSGRSVVEPRRPA